MSSNHRCNESEKLYEVSGEGKARLIARCPRCGGVNEEPPAEAKVCESRGGGCGHCVSRCIVLPDGGIWAVTMERAKMHFAKKLRDEAVEAFKTSCGPNYEKAERIGRRLKEGQSPLGLLCGLFFALVTFFLCVFYSVYLYIDKSDDLSEVFVLTFPSLFLSVAVGWLFYQPFGKSWEKKLLAQLEKLGGQPQLPSEKPEDYLGQVKIEVIEG